MACIYAAEVTIVPPRRAGRWRVRARSEQVALLRLRPPPSRFHGTASQRGRIGPLSARPEPSALSSRVPRVCPSDWGRAREAALPRPGCVLCRPLPAASAAAFGHPHCSESCHVSRTADRLLAITVSLCVRVFLICVVRAPGAYSLSRQGRLGLASPLPS